MSMIMDGELRSMVMAYRVTELQALLGFAGKNKTGRKNELQARCLELVKGKSPPIVMKIRELYRSIQASTYGQTGGSTYDVLTASSLSSRNSYGSTGDGKEFGRSIGYQRVATVDGHYRTVPICPDIQLKELPFYDIEYVLLRPTSLLNQGQAPKQETQHPFCLTPSQAASISKSREMTVGDSNANGIPISKIQYGIQIQLRFCAVDTSEEQDDAFPPGLIVKVNSRIIQLPHPIPSNRPGVEPKRPSKPLNITNNVKMCPHSTNTIQVQWVTDANKTYAMSAYIVRRLSSDDLFRRLKAKHIQPAEFTRGRIKEITTAEEEDLCAPTSIRVSVACPLGKSRMTYPCRSTKCKHLQCFDAQLFLLMNEKKPSFICPVCNKHLKFGDLTIDGFFADVIQNLSINAGNDIEVFPDGSWLPAVTVKSEIENLCPPAKRQKTEDHVSLNQTIDLDDDICIVEEEISPKKPSSSHSLQNGIATRPVAAEPEVIDLLDSSDEDTEAVCDTNNRSNSPPPSFRSKSPEEQEQEQSNSKPSADDDDDDEEDIGIRRTRRRTARVNYVEDSDSSSTAEGIAQSPPNPASQRPRSPACIELSDSPASSPVRDDPEPQIPRAFASLSSASSSSRSSSASASQQASRSGSGTSTLYSSAAMGTGTTTTTTTNPTGIGGSMMQHHQSSTIPPPPTFYSSSSTYSSSLSSGANISASPSLVSSASSYFSSAVPGYTAYDARSNWEADLNSFINPSLTYGQMDLTSYDYLSPTPHFPGYDPRSGGAGSSGGGGTGGGYSRWM